MFSWMRQKFGPLLVGTVIGLIAFVFIFSGLFGPKATRGLHEGSVAGLVNGESISLAEFNRAYNERLEMFKGMAGGKINEKQLKMFRIKESVFQELVNRELLTQAADQLGIRASDEEVRDRIREFPAFQKNGKFDPMVYRQVLEANRYQPGQFERMIRDDATRALWASYFKDRSRVSEAELKQEFEIQNSKREVKYLLLSLEDGKKLSPEKPEEARAKIVAFVEEWATRWDGSARMEQELNAALKKQGLSVQVQKTGSVSRSGLELPGMGANSDLVSQVFAVDSPNGSAIKLTGATWAFLGAVTQVQQAKTEELPQARATLMKQLVFKKERELYDRWIKMLSDSAKIEPNSSVVSSDADAES